MIKSKKSIKRMKLIKLRKSRKRKKVRFKKNNQKKPQMIRLIKKK